MRSLNKKLTVSLTFAVICLCLLKVFLEFHNQSLTSNWAKRRVANLKLKQENRKLKMELQTLLNKHIKTTKRKINEIVLL